MAPCCATTWKRIPGKRTGDSKVRGTEGDMVLAEREIQMPKNMSAQGEKAVQRGSRQPRG